MSGNANNGANAGFGYLNTNNRPANTNANIGFRLNRLEVSEKAIHGIKRDNLTDTYRPYPTEAIGTLVVGKKMRK